MEYPKNSGAFHTFPEIEKGGWYAYEKALKLINPKLVFFLDKLEEKN